jgi:Mg-chelatase subunit ChlD
MKTAIITGSLQDIATQSGQSIAQSFLSVDVVILVDVSGSMMAHDAPGGISRYDAAVNELKKVQESNPGKIAIISFSGNAQLCPSGVPLFEGGTTNLAGALQFAKMADVGGIRFIVISDGEPDSEAEALKVAASFQGEIHTIYIGPADDYAGGRAFLQRLATANHGTFHVAQLTKSLDISITKCLPAS